MRKTKNTVVETKEVVDNIMQQHKEMEEEMCLVACEIKDIYNRGNYVEEEPDMASICTMTTIAQMYQRERAKYVLPPFQRNYVWDEEDALRLLDKMIKNIKDFKNGKASVIMSFALCTRLIKNRILMIDGQQRLKTLFLIGLAIIIIAKEMEEAGIKLTDEDGNEATYEGIIKAAEEFVYYSPISNIKQKVLKIELDKEEEYQVNCLINGTKNADQLLQEMQSDERATAALVKNYKALYKRISMYIKNGGNIFELFDSIARARIIVAYCSKKEAADMYLAFNAYGKHLNKVEVSKGILYNAFDLTEMDEPNEKYWIPTENNVGRKNMSDFMVDFMNVISSENPVPNVKSFGPETLDKSMEAYLKGMKGNRKENSTQILKEMLKYSQLYKKYIRFEDGYNMNKATPLLENLFVLERIAGGRKANCVVLYLLRKFEEGKLKENVLKNIIEALVIVQIRNMNISGYKGHERPKCIGLLRKLIKAMDTSKLSSSLDKVVWKVYENYKGFNGIPSDAYIIDYMTKNDASIRFWHTLKRNHKACLYIFWKMNKLAYESMKDENKKYKLPEFDDKKMIVEHINPESTEYWEKNHLGDEQTMVNYVNNFGNLAMVSKVTTSQDWSYKSEAYKKDVFPLTRKIGNTEVWNTENIMKLNKLYAEYFCKAFKVPAEFNKKKLQKRK